MKEELSNESLAIWFRADRNGNKCPDRELAQSDRCLPIYAEIRQRGTAVAATEVHNIVIVIVVGWAGHCVGGVVGE